jgi:hypothetical protein
MISFLLPAVVSCSCAFAQRGTDRMPVDIGINVGGVADYAVESFFVDAMKQARHWGTAATPWDEAAAVDAQGWPTQDAGAVVLCCVADGSGRTELAGTYSLSFQGIATVGFVAFPGTVSNMQYDAATNTSTALLSLADSGAGTSLMLSFTNTQRTASAAVGTGVTNVTVLRPQHAPDGRAWWTSPGQVFTSPFLTLLRPFTTLRFMDFTATNGSPVTRWSQRTTLQSATQQSANGAAWEYVVLLANTLHRDIWINIPDQADSDYVTQLATLLHATLDPSVHIWLEYSNEVWNFSFAQAGRNQAAAEAIVAANPKSPLALGCADYANCRYEWGERLVGLQALQNGQIFKRIFGAQASMVRPVYATQLGQTYFVSLVFSMVQAAFGPPAKYFYALAQAPYWSGDNSLDGLTEAQELANAAANLATVPGPERGFAVWATDYGMRSVTYEGGPGMSGTASLDAKIAANRSSDMGSLVAQSLRQAFGNGISLYMYYNDAGAYGQYGMWGLTESVFDLKSPKLTAAAAVKADGTEPLSIGSMPPATIAAGTPDISAGSDYIVQGGAYAYVRHGGLYGYLLNVPAAGRYTVTLSAGNYYGATTGSLLVDRVDSAVFNVPATGGNLMNWTNTSATLSLTAGLHVLSIKATGGEFGFQSVSIAASP